MPHRPFGSLANLAARIAHRVFDLATYRSLLVIRNSVVSIGVLIALVIGASTLLRSCAEIAALSSKEAKKAAKAPVPGVTDRDRLPTWGEDETVKMLLPNGQQVDVRWGDVKLEAERGMLPEATPMGERHR